MAQLRIEQVKAPDFSASSEMMARANQSFVSGIESAKGILSKYNEGQQAKADNALTQLLAGASSEEELEQLMATTDISGMNISENMRANYLGARTRILGDNQTRQATSNAADANSRANAGEGRVAAEYADGVAARDELRSLTPAYVDALVEGQTTGRGSGVVAGVDLGAVESNYNLPSGYMATMAQIESGGDPNAQNPNSSAGGLFQQLDANAAEYGVANRFDPAQSADGAARFAVDNSRTLERVLGRAPTGAELYLAHQQGPGGASALLRNPNARAVDVVGADAVELNGGSLDMTAGEFAGIWINKFNRIQGNPTTNNAPITSNGTGGAAADAFTDALRAGTRLTPDEASRLYNSVLSQQAEGQSLIDAAEAKRQSEVAAAAQIAAIQNPNNTSQDAVTRDLLDTDGISAANALAVAGQDRSAFGGVIAPTLTPDTQVTDALARTAATDARTQSMDPQARLFAQAEEFDSSDNLGGALLEGFDLPEGSGLTPESVNRSIQRMADDAGVTAGEMAAVIAGVSQGNANQFTKMIGAAADTEMYASIMSIAERDFGASARDSRNAAMAETSQREAQRAAAELELSTARTRAAKLTVGSPERAAADRQVNELRDTVLRGMTPQERQQNLQSYVSNTGMASRLQTIQADIQSAPAGSPEREQAEADFFRAMAQLEDTIRTDPNLGDNEKELLLRDIRG